MRAWHLSFWWGTLSPIFYPVSLRVMGFLRLHIGVSWGAGKATDVWTSPWRQKVAGTSGVCMPPGGANVQAQWEPQL